MINTFTGRWFFLSNFYPIEIEYQGIKYPTVEHFYVSCKVTNDQMIDGVFMTKNACKEYIAKIIKPGDVKRFGRQKIKTGIAWTDEYRLKVMELALNQKFKNENLKELLLTTGSEDLVEGNYWHDNFFGSCGCPKCQSKGENHLGKLIMKIRENIKKNNYTDAYFPKSL